MSYRKFPEIRWFDWESTKQIEFDTVTAWGGSGATCRTLTTRLTPKWTITASYSHLTDAEARRVFGFFSLIRGAHEPFLWLDPEDYQETGVQLPALGSGQYQAVMQFGDYVQTAAYIEDVKVYVNGTLVTADKYSVSAGVITFSIAPADTDIVTADYTYYWLVRLSDDKFKTQHLQKLNANKSDSFSMVTAPGGAA